MTYTIKDDKGNMICSIENVDPSMSEENLFIDNLKNHIKTNGPKEIIVACLIVLVLAGFGINGIKKLIQNSKIKNRLGEDLIEKIVSYISNIRKELKTELDKCISKNKRKSDLISSVDINIENIKQKDIMKYIKKSNLSSFNISVNLTIKLKHIDTDDMYETLNQVRHDFIIDLENDIKHIKLMNGKCNIVDIDSNSREEINSNDMTIDYPFNIKISNNRELINEILNKLKN